MSRFLLYFAKFQGFLFPPKCLKTHSKSHHNQPRYYSGQMEFHSPTYHNPKQSSNPTHNHHTATHNTRLHSNISYPNTYQLTQDTHNTVICQQNRNQIKCYTHNTHHKESFNYRTTLNPTCIETTHMNTTTTTTTTILMQNCHLFNKLKINMFCVVVECENAVSNTKYWKLVRLIRIQKYCYSCQNAVFLVFWSFSHDWWVIYINIYNSNNRIILGVCSVM